ncbi:MAG TPA: hypothetical protein PLI90_07720 [Rhodocyclaceae bacterium]|nr:hypothetical protein [Rhodocyclaceae bacterium]
MQSPRQLIDEMLASLRQNRRLQAGMALIALLVAGEGVLRWNDHLTDKLEQLQQMRSELRNLRNQTRDEAALHKTLEDLRQARETVDSRLWVVSSEAVGQARLKDWLKATLKRAGIVSQSLKISAAQPVNERERNGRYSPGMNSGSATPPQNATPDADATSQPGLRQINATLNIPFTPATLEQLLGDIEGGDAYAGVEALTIMQREHRAELTIRILLRVDRNAASNSNSNSGNGEAP